MIQPTSGGNNPKYGPKQLGGPVAKAVYDKVSGNNKVSPNTRSNSGTLNDFKARPAKNVVPAGPRPKVGKPIVDTGKEPYKRPSEGPISTPGNRPAKPKTTTPATPKSTGPKSAPRNAIVDTGKEPYKRPADEPAPSKPGARPQKPAPAATVYRAKKGDGLWQVAEKTKPAGVSTAAWWTKIKKLNSTNGKVNRTYTNTGVKLPKS
jgi:hypothetical protein